MSLRSMMKRHAAGILGDVVGGFGEPITYRFKNGEDDLTLNAVVKRLDLEPSTPQSPQVNKLRANVEVPRHATLGILTVAKGDTIVLPMRIGDDPIECRIRRIVAQDDALFVLQVEA